MAQPNRPVDKFGFPIPVSFDDLPAPRKGFRFPESKYSRRILGILLGCVVLGLLVAPWLWKEFRTLMADRHESRALQLAWDDNHAAAIAEMDSAIGWRPEQLHLYTIRADHKLAVRDYDGALADANRVVSLSEPAEGGRVSATTARALIVRATIHRRRGDTADAIKDCTTAIDLAVGNNVMLLNHRAYYRALANVELEQALVDIELALKSSPENDGSLIDTRGFVYYRLGKHREALADLEKAIALANKQHDEIDEEHVPAPVQKRKEFLLRELEKSLAIMHEHRALVHDALGNAEQAKSDHAVAKHLGYDPEKGVE